MKSTINPKFLFLLCFYFFVWIGGVSAQSAASDFVVKGSVKNKKGEIIKGAILLLKGTTTGTTTDLEGNYSIRIPSKDGVLVCSFVGYASKEVDVKANKKLDIVLEAEASAPDEPGFESKETEAGKVDYYVFDKVEQKPRPATGDNGWNAFIAKNIRYPLEARQHKVEGTVILSFEVNTSGEVKNVEVLRGVGKELDQEAVRVVSSGPDWTPGMLAGEAVNTRVSLPIRFVINDDKFEKSVAQKKEKAIADQYKDYVVVVGYLPSK